MAAYTVMQALQSLIVPTGDYASTGKIPAANVELWYPATFDSFPHCIITLNRTSSETRKTLQRKGELHWIALEFFQVPAISGSLQAAQQEVYGWIEASKAAIRANKQLQTTPGDPSSPIQCLIAGESRGGQGMESSVDLVALDQSSGTVAVRGYLLLPVEDLEVTG